MSKTDDNAGGWFTRSTMARVLGMRADAFDKGPRRFARADEISRSGNHVYFHAAPVIRRWAEARFGGKGGANGSDEDRELFESSDSPALERWRQAKADCANIVTMIIERYKPKRLVQWGSLLDKEQFNERSDIDLALEGIVDAETYFALLGDAMNMTSFRVDIVQLEKIEPEFASLIRSKGIVIYERETADT